MYLPPACKTVFNDCLDSVPLHQTSEVRSLPRDFVDRAAKGTGGAGLIHRELGNDGIVR